MVVSRKNVSSFWLHPFFLCLEHSDLFFSLSHFLSTDYVPENIAVICDQIKHMNIMPVYGLNVYSMLKHDTLVLTLSAVEEIEAKLLFHMNRTDGKEVAAQTRKKEYV